MTETPETIAQWVRETFPGGDPKSPRKALRLLEEVVELCLACGASRLEIIQAMDASFKQTGVPANRSSMHLRQPQPDKVPGEIADAHILLIALADLLEIDLDAATYQKMQINRARTWNTLGDGTGYHVPKVD